MTFKYLQSEDVCKQIILHTYIIDSRTIISILYLKFNSGIVPLACLGKLSPFYQASVVLFQLPEGKVRDHSTVNKNKYLDPYNRNNIILICLLLM